ncbi:zinc ribbon domain-containing protein, partial [Ileibacterium valens]|uniref:zinc ribbon domain-containing protein n=1 Tax=Ileibacterium valens TaxID=1862668 RepID=UPI0034E4A62D
MLVNECDFGQSRIDLSIQTREMKNRKFAHAISQMQWYAFRIDFQFQCAKRGIEFRLADRRYPSSKTCHQCGNVHKDLKLSDRTFVCPDCGYTED